MARLFLVLGRSRTGSNLLVRMLDQHPAIRCSGEVFRDGGDAEWQANLSRLRADEMPWRGFKMFYYHGSEKLWTHLAGDAAIPVVHLKRWNVLRTAVSRKLAVESDRWVSMGDDPEPEKKRVTFTPQELESDFIITRIREAAFDERFRDHSVFPVEFEDLAADPEDVYRRVLRLLGLPIEPVEVRTRRQNPEPLRQHVDNFDELAEHFAGSPWAKFFTA